MGLARAKLGWWPGIRYWPKGWVLFHHGYDPQYLDGSLDDIASLKRMGGCDPL